MKTPLKDKNTKSSSAKSKIDTPVPPQVQYPLEKPDSKKNQPKQEHSSAKK